MKRLLCIITVTAMLLCSCGNIVYIVPDGECYHKSRECVTLQNSKIINRITIEEAKERSRRECKVCYED